KDGRVKKLLRRMDPTWEMVVTQCGWTMTGGEQVSDEECVLLSCLIRLSVSICTCPPLAGVRMGAGRFARIQQVPQQIFQDLGTDVLASAFEGYNACVFAYGQTGTGKTYTMMGDTDRLGLIPRISEGLFSRIDDHVGERVTFKTEVSYLEIYNERVRDLLCHPGAKANTYSLKVREHPEKGPYVQDLSRHLVSDYTSLERLIQRGNENRTTAATYIHDLSSRSHAIFTIYFSQAKLEDNLPREIVSKIHLVDLAGSERADPNYHKDRLKEGANINRSLVTLGTVISALAYQQEKGATSSPWTSENSLLSASTESFGSIGDDLGSSLGKAGKKMAFIPYRDSVLTWLLKDSLGGNAKTIMIAAISPASICYSETINTLRYARRAKRIVNRPKINEDPNVRLIRELRAEIGRLKKLLQNHDMRSSTMSLNEDRNQVITEMLMRNEEKVEQLTRDWSDKWDETQTIIQDHLLCKQSCIPVPGYHGDLSSRPARCALLTCFPGPEEEKWKWCKHVLFVMGRETRLGIRRPSSVGVIVESQLPHLIGMDDDMLSTGIVIYHLKDSRLGLRRPCRSPAAVIVDSELPHLIGMADTLLSTGIVIYRLKDGKTIIGTEENEDEPDIVLDGPFMEKEHCVIRNENNTVFLHPVNNAVCAVNGMDITTPIRLKQGAVILLGKMHMFRFNNPFEAARLRRERSTGSCTCNIYISHKGALLSGNRCSP
ncbi:stAR- lipid transfer, partial [Branchiostoma belcheri]